MKFKLIALGILLLALLIGYTLSDDGTPAQAPVDDSQGLFLK